MSSVIEKVESEASKESVISLYMAVRQAKLVNQSWLTKCLRLYNEQTDSPIQTK